MNQSESAKTAIRNCGHQEFLLKLLDAIPIMITVYDPSINRVELNQEVQRLTGWTQEDADREGIMNLVYPDPAYRQQVADFMLALHPGWRDITMTCRDGHTFEASWSNIRLTDERQVGIGIDLTERKKAEQLLRRVTQRFALLATITTELLESDRPQELIGSFCRRVMDHLDCQLFFNYLADDEAGRLRLNACAGIPEDEVRRIEWLDYGAAVCGCSARDGCPIVLERIQETQDERADRVRSYGAGAYACHPLLAENGKVMGTLSFGARTRDAFSAEDLSLMKAVADQVSVAMIRIRDERVLRSWKDELELRVEERTAELMETQRQLERNRRLSDIGMLASTVAHELRNPLAVIKTAVYNINRKKQGTDLDKHLHTVEKKIQESNQIINNLLMYSRIKQPIYEAVRVGDLLNDCLETVKARHIGQPVTFYAQLEAVGDLVAMFDRYQITEVMNNILNNAAQATFSENGGSVTVSAGSESGIVTIVVSDTGTGIDAGDLARVFDPFFTRKSKGTGLGLTICKELVSLHNGSIDIASEKGAGTTVTVVLPLGPCVQRKKA